MDVRVLQVVPVIDRRTASGGPITSTLARCQELRRGGHEPWIAGGWRGPDVGAARWGDPGGSPIPSRPPTDLDGVPCRLFRVPAVRVPGLLSVRVLVWLWRHGRTFDLVHVYRTPALPPLLLRTLLYARGVPCTVWSGPAFPRP